jgi:hypothetical protein
MIELLSDHGEIFFSNNRQAESSNVAGAVARPRRRMTLFPPLTSRPMYDLSVVSTVPDTTSRLLDHEQRLAASRLMILGRASTG